MPAFPDKPSAYLALADGTLYAGFRIGAETKSVGEVVFTTNMTGYQEVLTDPSYKGQLVTMTYPLQGNYGFRVDESEAPATMVEGFIVTEACAEPSAAGETQTLDVYLRKAGIPGISGIDTRALTRKLRDVGVMPGILTTEAEVDPAALLAEARALKFAADPLLVEKVSQREPRVLPSLDPSRQTLRVVAFDFGAKESILRYLREEGCEVVVLGAAATAEEVLAQKPDGLFLSNGPGDPADLGHIVQHLKALVPSLPTFGICLGHQLLGLTFGASTYKMKFGHRGGNHPILDKDEDRILITTQNHGYALDEQSLAGTGLRLTHVNLNDHTVAGVAHTSLPCFSVQFHPEAAPGPHDARYLFTQFRRMLEARHAEKN